MRRGTRLLVILAREIPCSSQLVSIDVSDRNPKDHREGISYKLMAESCIPGINITDAASIFEEHRVVRHLSVLGQLQQKRQVREDYVLRRCIALATRRRTVAACTAKKRKNSTSTL